MHLDGIRIISFNHFLMGPLGIQFLADLGADVIAVEPTSGAFQRHWGGMDTKKAGGETTLGLVANRNKKSISLNLKDPDALDIAKTLIKDADVVAENFRPGVMNRLGLGYEATKVVNPCVIYAAATGFGADGPYVNRPGQDMIAQSISGLAWINGKVGETPRLVGASAIDHHGAMIFAAGILAALVKRERTGEGGRIEVNLLSAALNIQAESLVCYFNGEKPEVSQQLAHVGSWYHEAPYGIYETLDGFIGLSLNKLEPVFDALEIPPDTRIKQNDAYARREEITQIVAAALKHKTFSHWAEIFEARKIWYAEVNDYEQLANDPQIRHNGDLTRVEGRTGETVTLVSHPVRYDGELPPINTPPQKLGAQTAEIVKGIGYTDDDVAALAARGAIGLS